MKEIFQVIDTRIRSPFWGYFVMSFFALNWKGIFYIVVDNGTAASRIEYFSSSTDLFSTVVYPAVIGTLLAVTYPWISYFFLYLCKMPTKLKNDLQAQSEHDNLVKKKELEQIRGEILSDAEKRLLEQAERDSQLEKVEDEEVKSRTREKLKELRSESGQPSSSVDKNSDPEHLLEMAKKYRETASKVPIRSDEYDSLKEKARNLEERAHNMLMGEYL